MSSAYFYGKTKASNSLKRIRSQHACLARTERIFSSPVFNPQSNVGGRMNEAVRVRRFGVAATVVIAVLLASMPANAATACEKLNGLVLSNAKIDSAQMVAAGAFVQPGGRGNTNAFARLPAFCRVAATLTPSSDSDIKAEIWLPETGWN